MLLKTKKKTPPSSAELQSATVCFMLHNSFPIKCFRMSDTNFSLENFIAVITIELVNLVKIFLSPLKIVH